MQAQAQVLTLQLEALQVGFDPFTKVGPSDPSKIVAKDATLETRFKTRFDPLIEVGRGDPLKVGFGPPYYS